jgi:hypothetical protein
MTAPTLLHISNPAWTALAAWAAVGLALLAGLVAFFQLREARRLRAAQAQPYVAIYTEENAAVWTAIDLVIKNFGATVAMDIRVAIDPAPQRAAGGSIEDVWTPQTIETLVPGQEWRTFWDTTLGREESELPSRYDAKLVFADTNGAQFNYAFVLDWEPLTKRGAIVASTPHDGVQALEAIRDTLAGWRENAAGGLRVVARDGDARDERAVEARKQREAQVEQDTPEGS